MATLTLFWRPVFAWAWLVEDDFKPVIGPLVSESQVRLYRVKLGETVWEIAKKAAADVEVIMMINDLPPDGRIYEGQYLKIPYAREKLHRVRAGESLWRIARMYQVGIEEMQKANPGLAPSFVIQPGQLIRIPATANLKGAVPQEYPSRGLMPSFSGFSWPVFGHITSGYGLRKSGFHHGIDIACALNTPIKAVKGGKVVFAGHRRVYGYTVIIRHKDGTETLYAHAKKILVKKGDKVAKGQKIATVGVSGRTTGPHLHFEVHHEGKTVNPLMILHKR